jgi:hypothetical protein
METQNDSQCYAITLNNERCKNNTIRGSKWCSVHYDSCQSKRKTYKKSCETIKNEKIKCKHVDTTNLSINQIDDIIADYRKLLNLSNRCLDSRENFENYCIVEDLQNKGHLDFKNKIDSKKYTCEKNLKDLVDKRLKKLESQKIFKKSISKEEEINLIDNSSKSIIIPPKKSKKKKLNVSTENFDDILLQFKLQESESFNKESLMIEQFKKIFKNLYDEVEKIGIKYVDETFPIINNSLNPKNSTYSIKEYLHHDREEAKEIVLLEIIDEFNKNVKDDRLKNYLKSLLESLYDNFNKKYKNKNHISMKDKDFNKTIYPNLDIKFQNIENVETLIDSLQMNFIPLYKKFLEGKMKKYNNLANDDLENISKNLFI